MTTPFGMPTFVKVGKKKTPKILAPNTPKPPTESGNPPSPLTDIRTYTYDGNGTKTSHEWKVPSAVISGDGIMIFLITDDTMTITPPSGYTVLEDQVSGQYTRKAYWKISDGTEVDTTFTVSGGGGRVAFMSGRVPANGATLTTPEVTEGGSVNGTTTEWDPPAISPAGAPNTYHIISANLMVKGDPDPDATSALSTGYSLVSYFAASADVLAPKVYVQQKASTSVATTEDPGIIDWSASTGSRDFHAFTIAVLVSGSDPTVAPFDHDHVEADITDLSHTDGDAIHDNVSGEIAAVTEKVSPVSADLVLIEDSEATNAKKKVQLGNLPGGSSDHGALTGLADDDHTQYLLAAGTRAATYLEVSGLTGATGSSPRFVGGTTSGAPASGTFALGDYVVTEDGNIYVCTTAGTPGTWTAVGAGAATDSDAIHDNVAGEISALTLVTAASGDHVLIEDASDSNNKKRVAASDFLAGGGGSTVPDWVADLATPDSAHGDDQEFTGTIGGTAVTPTGTVTWTQDEGLLSAAFDSQSSGDQAARLYSLTPVASPVTITTRMRMLTRRTSNPMLGLMFADGTTTGSTATSVGIYATTGGPILARWAGTITNMSTTNLFTDLTYGLTHQWVYLRLIWSASNTFEFAISLDGISWTDFGNTGWAATLTPTHFGPWVSGWSQTFVQDAAFEYVRVAESDLSV